jgi:hypothetical protein
MLIEYFGCRSAINRENAYIFWRLIAEMMSLALNIPFELNFFLLSDKNMNFI